MVGKNVNSSGGAHFLLIRDSGIKGIVFLCCSIIRYTSNTQMANKSTTTAQTTGTVTITSEEYFNLLGVKLVRNPNGSVADLIKQQRKPIPKPKTTPMKKSIAAKSIAKPIAKQPMKKIIPKKKPPTTITNIASSQSSINKINSNSSTVEDDNISIGTTTDLDLPARNPTSSIDMDTCSVTSRSSSMTVECIYASTSQSPMLPRLPDFSSFRQTASAGATPAYDFEPTPINRHTHHRLIDDQSFNKLADSIIEPAHKTNKYRGSNETHLKYTKDVLDYHLRRAIRHSKEDFDNKFLI